MMVNPDKVQYTCIVFGKIDHVNNFIIGYNVITPENNA